MNTVYPQRPETHQLEEVSRRFFLQCMPANWVSERPADDYGIDLRVDIFEGNLATGLELLIQLKSSEQATEGETEFIILQATTYNLLKNKLQTVMLVKYSRSENEAYWILLKDTNAPQEGRSSVTIRIPKTNRLSQINWNEIQAHARNTSELKLEANRGHMLESSGPQD